MMALASRKALAHFGGPTDWYGVIGEDDIKTNEVACKWQVIVSQCNFFCRRVCGQAQHPLAVESGIS
jgi:hypothetical protein